MGRGTTRSVLVVGTLLVAMGAAAVWISTYSEDPSCPDCALELERRLTLGPALPGGEFMLHTRLARDSAQRIYAAPVAARGVVARFRPDGSMDKLIGSFGGGPGELDEVRSIQIGPGDSLLILDHSNRISVFDSSGAYARTILPDVTVMGITYAGGQLYANTRMDRDATRPVLWKISPDGRVSAGFGTGNAERPSASLRSVVHAGASIYSFSPVQYGVRRHTPSEAPLGRTPRWWRQRRDGRDFQVGRTLDVRLDARDRVWLLVSRLDLSTVPQPGGRRSREVRESYLTLADYETRYDWMLDILAPNGSLYARVPMSGSLAGFLGDDLYRFGANAAGELEGEILRVRLVPGPQRSP